MRTLRCGLFPDGSGKPGTEPEQLHEPLRDYLQRHLGIAIELVAAQTCAAPGEALRRGELDFAYLGPVTYIVQSRTASLEPFARPTHGSNVGPTFQAAIIVPRDSEVDSLAQLRGADVAFGDLMSTAGHWAPRHMLLKSGLSAENDYRRRQLGSHAEVIATVAAHRVAAGGLSLPTLRRMQAAGCFTPDEVRILAKSPPIPESMWTFCENLPLHLREDLRQAFGMLRSPQVLAPFRAEAFIPAVDADVDRVRHWLEDLLQARL